MRSLVISTPTGRPSAQTTLQALTLAAVFLLPLAAAFPARADETTKQLDQDVTNLNSQVTALTTADAQLLDELNQLKQTVAARSGGAVAAANAPEAPPAGPASVYTTGLPSEGTGRVALVEFGDFQCPHCQKFVQDTYGQIVDNYIKTGKITYFRKDIALPEHGQAVDAALAAHCAGNQGKYWEMHDSIYADQSSLSDADLESRAQKLGLDTYAFNKCLSNSDAQDKLREESNDLLTNGNLGGTPTFVIGTIGQDGVVHADKTLLGAKSFDVFKANLDAEIASVGQ